MTDIDIVAELRRLYAAAIQHAGDLDETASVLALNIAVVHYLPALLDVVEAARKAAGSSRATHWSYSLWALQDALAALERSDEG